MQNGIFYSRRFNKEKEVGDSQERGTSTCFIIRANLKSSSQCNKEATSARKVTG